MVQNHPEMSPVESRLTPETNVAVGPSRVIAVVGGFLLLILIALLFLLPKMRHSDALKADVREQSGPPPVAVSKVLLGQVGSKLEIPGTVQAFAQTPIYARTAGYISKRFVDIGDRVRAGQVLAVIDDPQTQQALRQSQATVMQLKAQLAQARANANLSTINNGRFQQLLQQGVISQAAADQQFATSGANDATVQAALANVAAGEANVRSLEQQASFAKVTAPFAGTVLSRSVDTGSLISAGSATNVTQLFTIGQSATVRVFVNVPQSSAPAVMATNVAEVTFRELPGRVFKGAVTRNANSIDVASRTLLAEIDLPNADAKILPGMFAAVAFNTKNLAPPALIPANALFVRAAGPQTYVMDSKHIAHLRNLVLGRDFGTSTEVLSGLKAGDIVVLSPSDSIEDGTLVEPTLVTK